MEMMEERDFQRWIVEGATLDSGVFLQLLRLVSTTFRRAVHGWALWTFLKKGIAEFSFLPQKHKSSRKKKGIISAEGVIAILPDDLQRQGFRATGINGIPLGLG